MRTPPRTLPILAVSIAAVFAFHRPFRDLTLTILRLPLTAVRAVAGVLLALPRLPSLAQENAALRARLAERQLESARLRELLRHTQQGQALTEAASAPRGIVAIVIGRSTIPTQHTVVLNRGERQGLTVNSVILDAVGVAGRVIDAQPSSCLVMLVTDPESRIAAAIERSRETGLLAGRGRGHCELIYLDAQADIQEGDRVVTAGLGGFFPKGLLLGTVARVVRDEPSGSTSAWVSPAAHLGRLEEVLCLPAPS